MQIPIYVFLFIFFPYYLFSFPTVFAETISIYIYHHQPPFIIGNLNDNQGMIYDLRNLLNQNSKDGLQFKVKHRPRARLNKELESWINNDCSKKKQNCDNNWIIFGVTPKWGWGADAEQRFLWVDLFNDKDVIISLHSNKIEYENPTSLIGKTFGSIRGHKYPTEIDNLFKSGELKRKDGSKEWIVLMRLAYKRGIDVTMLQQSAIDYLFKNDKKFSKIKHRFYIAPKPLKKFMLQIMIPPNREDIQFFLNQVKQNSGWKKLFQKYDIK